MFWTRSRGSSHREREAQQDAPDKARFCISNVSIPTIDAEAGLGPRFREFRGALQATSVGPTTGPRAPGGGQRCGRGLDLFFAPFELLRILFNHGFKARDVLNARFQFQPILFD